MVCIASGSFAPAIRVAFIVAMIVPFQSVSSTSVVLYSSIIVSVSLVLPQLISAVIIVEVVRVVASTASSSIIKSNILGELVPHIFIVKVLLVASSVHTIAQVVIARTRCALIGNGLSLNCKFPVLAFVSSLFVGRAAQRRGTVVRGGYYEVRVGHASVLSLSVSSLLISFPMINLFNL